MGLSGAGRLLGVAVGVGGGVGLGPTGVAVSVGWGCPLARVGLGVGVGVATSDGVGVGVMAVPEEPHPVSAAPAPPPTNIPYWQYGVSLVSEGVIDSGAICSDPKQPCIFGSGAGIAIRLGVRTAGPWYFGGAYELSKQDPNNLYRLAILQQLRAEARYYLDTGRDVQ